MKIKNFNNFLTKLNENWSDIDDIDDDEFLKYDNELDISDDSGNQYDEDDDEDDDAISNMQYLLRQLFKNSGIDDVSVTGNGIDISISIVLQRRESLSYILKIFEVLSKIKKDILPQYDSDIDLWKTKKFEPLLIFSFTYNEGLDDDNLAF